MKKIIIDLYGADNGPEELLRGAVKAASFNPDLGFVLVGDEAASRAFLEKEGVNAPSFTFIHATDYITNHEPAMAIFKGRDECSTAKALDALKSDEDAIGLLGAGNTGALMVGSIFRLGLTAGLKSPALSTLLPNVKGGMTTLVDCGANINIDAVNLVDFARLGSDFAKKMFDLEAPTVALLNVGRTLFVNGKLQIWQIKEKCTIIRHRNRYKCISKGIRSKFFGNAFSFFGSGYGISGADHHRNITFKKAENYGIIIIFYSCACIKVHTTVV